MPTKRRPLTRQRRPSFSREVLELFRKLENGPERGKSYGPQERVLMRELDLVWEWWGGVCVTGDMEAPRPWLARHADWVKCQEIRRQLLEAVEELEELEERAATGGTAQAH